MALRGRGPRNTNELLSVLTEFEESPSFCENRREENRPRPPVPYNNQNERRGYDNRANYRGGYNRGPPPANPQANVNDGPVHQLNVSGNAEEARG